MSRQIPFNRPYVAQGTRALVEEALSSGRLSGDGPMTARARDILEGMHGGAPVLLTTSCTHALELASIVLGLGPGAEVVVPAFTFVSTVNAFAVRGARPVFVDVREETLNMDEAQIESVITDRTRAIFPVHYASVACQMDVILEIAERRNLAVVEDAAQALGATWQGRPLGTLGDFGALSFHETKNISCGEGGALIVNQPQWLERAEVVREKGTDRSRFLRGEVDRYGWLDIGSSYLPSDLLAAVLVAQLLEFDRIQSQRQAAVECYTEAMAPLFESGWARPLGVPDGSQPNAHLYGILLEDEPTRDRAHKELRDSGIQAAPHYPPLHLSPMGRRLGYREGMMPVTESIAGRLLRLPLFTGITEAEQAAVVEALSLAAGGRPV